MILIQYKYFSSLKISKLGETAMITGSVGIDEGFSNHFILIKP